VNRVCVYDWQFFGLWSKIGSDTFRALVEFGLKYYLHDFDEEACSKMLVKCVDSEGVRGNGVGQSGSSSKYERLTK